MDSRWLAAAVVGTYWGAFEIIIGSFLHNLRVPMSGTILSFFAVLLLVAFHQLWNEPGIFWRAGLVAALMKSISPSAIILGPMTGILMEALLLEVMVFLLGKNLLGYLLGGALAVMSALLHKIITVLVLYGFNLVKLLANIYDYAMQKLGIHQSLTNPWYAVYLLMGVYIFSGIVAALLGYYAGRRAVRNPLSDKEGRVERVDKTINDRAQQKYSLLFLLLHLVLLVGLLYVVNSQKLWIATGIVALYITVVMIRYRNSTRHLKKPFFWIQLVVITLLAAIFWNGLQTGNFLDAEGISIGIRMNLRAFLVMVSFSAVSVELRNPLVQAVLYKNGFSRLYHALRLSFSALPEITRSFSKPKQLIRHPLQLVTKVLQHANALMVSFRTLAELRPPILFISGPVGCGKTSFLEEVMVNLSTSDLKICGFVAPAIHENGRRIGYNLRVVPGKEEKLLSRESLGKGKISTGRFVFVPETIHWGEKMLHPENCRDYDLLVIDEIGPLELKGQGWAKVVDRLLVWHEKVQVWVVRSAVLDHVQSAWLIRPEEVFIPGRDHPADAAAAILRMMDRPPQKEEK